MTTILLRMIGPNLRQLCFQVTEFIEEVKLPLIFLLEEVEKVNRNLEKSDHFLKKDQNSRRQVSLKRKIEKPTFWIFTFEVQRCV